MKTLRIPSGGPLVCCALAVLLYAAVFGMGSTFAYIGAAVLFFLLLAPLQRFFPDRTVVVDDFPKSGDAQINQLLAECAGHLERIRSFSGVIYDPWLLEKVNLTSDAFRKLLYKLGEQPALQGQLRTFMRYYLPTTVTLLQIRVKLQDTRNASPTALSTRKRIDEALLLIEQACNQQLEAIDRMESVSVETEMQVLKELLGQSGLLHGQEQQSPHGQS